MHKNKFAVVRQWPHLQNAETECTARLKLAAKSISAECIEITPGGNCVETGKRITQDDVDFAIHLHYETPKAYDIFSFVALWNPLQFFHEWGYRRCARHLITHDDFLSCLSPVADDHVKRMIWHDDLHLAPDFTMFHSLSEPIIEPKPMRRKLFYIGINWDRLGKGKSRHQELLNQLDGTGQLAIYGPKIFQDVEIWKGYKSYRKEIPFDGTSVIEEIADVGAALVFSSEAHLKSELMSSRLFESAAAGVVVICDSNPFARRHFNDTVLYVDTEADDISEQVLSHMEWMNSHQEEAAEMAARCQSIFLEKFTLDKSLLKIYAGIDERKNRLSFGIDPVDHSNPRVRVFYILADTDDQSLESCSNFCGEQDYSNIDITVLVDSNSLPKENFTKSLLLKNPGIQLLNLKGLENYCVANLGYVFSFALESLKQHDFEYFGFVLSSERPFSNHISSLVRLMDINEGALVGTGTEILQHEINDNVIFESHLNDRYTEEVLNNPTGYSRFIFCKSVICPEVFSMLQYLNRAALAPLIGNNRIVSTLLATVVVNIQTPHYTHPVNTLEEVTLVSDAFENFQTTGASPSQFDNSMLGTIAIRLKYMKMPKSVKRILRRIYHSIR